MLSENIQDFVRYYRDVSKGPFSHDEFTREFTEILVEILYNDLGLDDNDYLIKASVGQGAWAEIPWIAIIHRGITETTQYGYYVVLLFSRDLNTIYISLGLGWAQFVERYGNRLGRINAMKCAERLSVYLSDTRQDIVGPINLGAKTARGRGYEISNIIATKIPVTRLTDERILAEITIFLNYYGRLIKEYGADLFYDLEDLNLPDDYKDVMKVVRQASAKVNKMTALKELVAMTEIMPPKKRKIYSNQIIRNRAFADYVKMRADFVCEICGRYPFKKKNGQFYAEADHIDALFLRGKDHPDNMRCLCALCHRVVTYGSNDEIESLMKNTIPKKVQI
jgi:5-methylcytosine-specific restriction protein A